MGQLIVLFLLVRVFGRKLLDDIVCGFVIGWGILLHAWNTVFHVADLPRFVVEAVLLAIAGALIFFTFEVRQCIRTLLGGWSRTIQDHAIAEELMTEVDDSPRPAPVPQVEWPANLVDERHPEAAANRVLLSKINCIPDVFGFTTGMGRQVILREIDSIVSSASLDGNCDLAHCLYAYAMGWRSAPVAGNAHGSFSRLKAIAVLQRFPRWPEHWNGQLQRVQLSLRRSHQRSDEG